MPEIRDMANFEDIDNARKLLGLEEAATLKEIRRAYRRKAFRHHPDRSGGDENSSQNEQIMKKLNWAYKLLTEYCTHYKCSFREDDVARTYPYDEYLRKYYYGWFNGT